MNITIITTQLGGTGGALNCIAIVNKFILEGHKVKIYSEQMPAQDMLGTLKAEVQSVREAPAKLNSDVAIAFNITNDTKRLLYSSSGRKFARLGIIVPEYQDVMRNNDVVKITTSTYEVRYVEAYRSPVVAIPGPVDITNFYPEYIQRSNNIVLTYIKKSGWVGISAVNQAQDLNRDLIFASLTDDGVDSAPIKSRYPIAILGCSAHLRSHMRYCYNRVGMFVDTHSNGLWGWNCTVGEAMLCKCPVVATDSPIFNDIVIPNETALTAPHNEANEVPNQDWKTRPDPKKISEHILTIYNNPKLATTLVENAYERVRKFDINFWYSEFRRLL